MVCSCSPINEVFLPVTGGVSSQGAGGAGVEKGKWGWGWWAGEARTERKRIKNVGQKSKEKERRAGWKRRGRKATGKVGREG